MKIRGKGKLMATAAAIVVLAVIVLVVAQVADRSDTAALKTFEAPSSSASVPEVGEPITVKEGALAAENGKFQLYWIDAFGQVRIRNKTTGKEWSGVPKTEKALPPNQVKLISNSLVIYYTEGKEIVSTNPAKEKAVVNASSIDDGLRIDYDFETLGLKLAVMYRLTDQGLDVTMPFSLIEETSNKRLTGVELFPFLDAGAPGDPGALFVPDGSGAIMTFDEKKSPSVDFYSEYIYGGDHAFQKAVYEQVSALRFETIAKSPREKIALPVFGLYKGNRAFLGIVTQGAADAKINAYPAGVQNIPLFRISTQFVYRQGDSIFVGANSEVPLMQRDMIPGDRSIRYIFLEDDKANYVGMAESYREYLLKEEGVAPSSDLQPRLQIRLFGGVEQTEVIGNSFVKMTTFEQARTIIDRFIAAGVPNLEVTYEGWSADGLLGDQPAHFPAAAGLGGNKELKKLAAYLKEKDIPLYGAANYVKPFSESSAVKPGRDAIRGLNKEVMNVYKPWVTNMQMSRELYYLLKPWRVYDRYIDKEAGKFSDVGFTGVQLDYMGEMIYSDLTEPVFNRAQTIEVWRRSMDHMRESTGRSAVNYGFSYALGHVDRINDIPVDFSQYIYLDEAVPFYQIAIHGLIPYSATPANLADDPRVYKLKLLEFGAMPSYKLSHSPTSDLRRSRIDAVFNGAYQNWIESATAEYEEISSILEPLAGLSIVDHELLASGVKRTTYEDGTSIIVNYNPGEVRVEGKAIAGFGYKVLKGGNESS
ncbi:DUF5696 domain-containing protein [Paenibacillus harenae]|uniref:Uncharacterized protein n=1 Tax=Paenibacillus harenae TaxID=306543 RepID=A0ABT9U4A1_PAEHA|nr:DUF5696 domain-containing protein [Paenibacillus harenae]MDQ0114469.1 hypothetical protein [Paenibacillus harenae]